MAVQLGNNIRSYLGGSRALSKAASRGEFSNSIIQNQFGTGSSSGTGMKNQAFTVREHATALADDGRNSIISKAVESGDTKEVRQEVTDFVDSYNGLINRLNKNGETMDKGHLKELSKLMSDSAQQLKAVGITVEKSGKLALDKTVLATAKAEDLQKCFQGSNSLAAKVATKSVAIGVEAMTSSGSNSVFGDNGATANDMFSSISGAWGSGKQETSVVSSARAARYRARYSNRV